MMGTKNNAEGDMIVRRTMPPFYPGSGTPAIIPYLNADDPSLSTYTAEDARAYVEQHCMDTPRGLVVMAPCRVEPGIFVDNRFGGKRRVCEVRVYGPFRRDVRPPRFDIELIFDYLVYTFDARTGNLLKGGRHQWNDMTGYPSHEFDAYLEGLGTPRLYRQDADRQSPEP
jgi:hypothetical protein